MTYLATNVFDADGVKTFWDFSFAGVSPDSDSGTTPYLSFADVKALELYRDIEGNAAAAERIVTIDPALPLRANIAGAPVASGRQIKIYRSTEIRYPLVDYRDRQSVSEADLDLANRQAIFVAQETQDAASNNMALDKTDNYDVKQRRIVNLANGVDQTDAVNKFQLDHAIRVPQSEAIIPALAAAASRAGKVLSFDAFGLPVTNFPNAETALGLEMRLASGALPTEGASMVDFTLGLGYLSGVGLALTDLFRRFTFSDDYLDSGIDPTGLTSSAAGIAVMFAAAKANGSDVFFRPGTYLIDAQCDYSGIRVHAVGASFKFDWSAANPSADITGFRAKESFSQWSGGIFDIIGTSFTSATAAQINGTRQGGFWVGEYFKAGTHAPLYGMSLRNMMWNCTGGFHGCNQIQITGYVVDMVIDQIHGESDGRAGRLLAVEWGKDTVANKTYHPSIIPGTITGNGYKQKFSGCVLFMSGAMAADGGIVRSSDSAQALRMVAGDNGETLALPQFVGRILKGVHFSVINGSTCHWRGWHISGRGDTGNLYPQVTADNVFVSGQGATVIGTYFEGLSASFAGGETGTYSAPGMKAVYKAFGSLTIENLRVQNFAGSGIYQGTSGDADTSANSFGPTKIGLLDCQNLGGLAYYISAGANSFESMSIERIEASDCLKLPAAFAGNMSTFGGYGVSQADLTRVVEINIDAGRIGVLGSGASFGIRSPGGNVRANYKALKVGNGTVFATAVSHGSSGNADKVTHLGCDFVGTVGYGGAAVSGSVN